ncbi:CHAP domain-containing protein [Nocardia blacklockiae]|uniref:CHAP domain-containing protein n=1 Tax=Nocardia blacklockiae TaxID=480036 RepID=UPI00189547A0|nr:CHAP domain-containing protein [Nocardia blacklockiae]MBF6174454.1 CHAP domain-containing protein [Nocardia blacklockiae]
MIETTRARNRFRWLVVGAVVVLAIALFAGVRWWQHEAGREALAGARLTAFPEIDPGGLDPEQARVVAVLRAEFARPGAGPKYAEGVEEPWCADFVSWVLRAAGQPLDNPNSGSWRIPGVATLREYFEARGSFEAADSGYLPRVGDVVLYDASSPFGQHTNIVLAADAATLTTIGGNEQGDIRIHHYVRASVPGMVGFGRR